VVCFSQRPPDEKPGDKPNPETRSVDNPDEESSSDSADLEEYRTEDDLSEEDTQNGIDGIPPELRSFPHILTSGGRLNSTLKQRVKQYFGFGEPEPETPYALFRVTPEMRYRFRLIGAHSAMCPLVFAIERHRMTVIAVDGDPVRALPVDSITIAPGMRNILL